jgi:hypothetical protein
MIYPEGTPYDPTLPPQPVPPAPEKPKDQQVPPENLPPAPEPAPTPEPTPVPNPEVAARQKDEALLKSLGESVRNQPETVTPKFSPEPMTFTERIVSKMKMGYKQLMADFHEEKSVAAKTKMDTMDLKINALDESKKSILSIAEDLKKQGMPGNEKLLLKLRDLDRERDSLSAKKDKHQSKFEAKQNKVKMYTNERDAIAGKLIEHYDAKLEPMEKKLEELDSQKNELDMDVTVLEIKHSERENHLRSLEEKNKKLEASMKAAGLSESEIRRITKISNEQIITGRKEMKDEMEKISEHRAKINEKIAKAEKKANPYRDKREQYVRVTKDRPIKMRVTARRKGEPVEVHEEINSGTREPEPGVVSSNETVSDGASKENLPAGGFMGGKEGGPKGSEGIEKNGPTLGLFVEGWNVFLKKEGGRFGPINVKSFFETARVLSKDTKLNLAQFEKILTQFYKMKTSKGVNIFPALANKIDAYKKAVMTASKKPSK